VSFSHRRLLLRLGRGERGFRIRGLDNLVASAFRFFAFADVRDTESDRIGRDKMWRTSASECSPIRGSIVRKVSASAFARFFPRIANAAEIICVATVMSRLTIDMMTTKPSKVSKLLSMGDPPYLRIYSLGREQLRDRVRERGGVCRFHVAALATRAAIARARVFPRWPMERPITAPSSVDARVASAMARARFAKFLGS
jgi:hypothetical protein